MKMYVLLSHTMTAEQKDEAIRLYDIVEFIYPPPALQELWASIPPEKETLDGEVASFIAWLEPARVNELIWLQGEPGIVFALADWALSRGLVPVYSTTRREAYEKSGPDKITEVVHYFSHVRFRHYRRVYDW